MFFSIKLTGLLPQDASIYNIKNTAKRRILIYNLHVCDIQMDEYLRLKTKKGLKETCLNIVDTCDYNFTSKTELIVTSKDQKLFDLMQLITCGDNTLFGSKILKFAFNI